MKIRVGVLMGGRSIEREVSFNSGRTICDHLDTSCYEIIPLFQTVENELFIFPWRFLYRGKIADFKDKLHTQTQQVVWDNLSDIIDFMYISTHGRYAEDGTLQGFLEVLGIPYLGSKVFASALGMDKIRQKEILELNGIETPRALALNPQNIDRYKNQPEALAKRMAEQNIAFPVIIKPYREGSSLGMTAVYQQKELCKALDHASTINPGKQQSVLIEEKIQGMEFTCITITDYKQQKLSAFPPTEIISEKGSHFFDYDQKYMPGRATKYTPARCSKANLKRIQDTCIKTMQILNIENISRIDGFLTDDNRVLIFDPNTLSGMAPSSFLFRQAAEYGMGHTALINHLIETELKQYGLSEKKKALKKRNVPMEPKKRVAVVMGGISNEKEISLESGRNIVYKLSPQKYKVTPLFLNKDMKLFQLTQQLLVRHSTQEIEDGLDTAKALSWSDLPKHADFVFLALHGGNGENGTIQGTLEMLSLPYNGSSVLTSALCMDKFKTNNILRAKNFAVPNNLLITKKQWQGDAQNIIKKFPTLPIIIKPHNDGCSVMVHKVTSIKEANSTIAEVLNKKDSVLVEECITGVELTVGIVGNETPRALPPSQACANKDVLTIEEKFLPGAGENQTPAPLSPSALQYIQETVTSVYKAVGCQGYARIDCFYQNETESPTGKERVIIIEINTLPAMTPATVLFHQAAEIGIKPMDFVDMIIELGFEAHQPSSDHKKFAPKEKVPLNTLG